MLFSCIIISFLPYLESDYKYLSNGKITDLVPASPLSISSKLKVHVACDGSLRTLARTLAVMNGRRPELKCNGNRPLTNKWLLRTGPSRHCPFVVLSPQWWMYLSWKIRGRKQANNHSMIIPSGGAPPPYMHMKEEVEREEERKKSWKEEKETLCPNGSKVTHARKKHNKTSVPYQRKLFPTHRGSKAIPRSTHSGTCLLI